MRPAVGRTSDPVAVSEREVLDGKISGETESNRAAGGIVCWRYGCTMMA
jgi:hypothetical protein